MNRARKEPTVGVMAAVLLAALAMPAHADVYIYKWTDANGGVNYSDEPPSGLPSTRIEFEPPEPHDAAAALGDDALQHPRLLEGSEPVQGADEPGPENERAAGAAEFDAGSASLRCAQSRMQIAMLREALPVYRDTDGRLRAQWRFDTYDGPREYISDLDRTAEVDRLRLDVAAFCEQPDDATAQSLARVRWMRSEYCAKSRADLSAAEAAGERTAAAELEDRRRAVERYCTR